MIRIIAECAQGYYQKNYQESIDLAKMLVRVSKASGADAVKFQLILARELCTYDYEYHDLFSKLEIGENGWQIICDVAKELNIEIMFDIFGIESLKIAESLGIKTIKIHPTDFRNKALLKAVCNSNKIHNVIAGCGGSLSNEISDTLKIFNNKKYLTLLHGFQGYPTPFNENCLKRINTLKELAKSIGLSNYQLGFADHADPNSLDCTNLAVMAIGMGVETLEKHITLTKCLNLEDNESALSPDEFKIFVENIRRSKDYLGCQEHTMLNFSLPPTEEKYRNSCIRHVVAAKDLKSGQIIKEEDICLKRSSSTSPLTSKDELVGKKLVSDIPFDQYLTKSDIKNE